MGEHTNIAWCDHTFNAWIGCAKVSPACKFCYAEIETFPRVQRGRGLELWGANAARHVTSDDNWKQLKRWNRAAKESGERRIVFVNSMSDVMEVPADPLARANVEGARDRLYEQIEMCESLTFLLLTKRPENYPELLPPQWLAQPHGRYNVWLGTTAEDQEHLDLRAPELRKVPAAVHWLSIEPQLGPIDLSRHMWPVHWSWDAKFKTPQEALAAGAHAEQKRQALVSAHANFIKWVICGGESGSKARPFDLAWARALRDQCKASGAAFFMKQVGSLVRLSESETWTTVHPKGGEPSEWPEDLRVRDMPRGATP